VKPRWFPSLVNFRGPEAADTHTAKITRIKKEAMAFIMGAVDALKERRRRLCFFCTRTILNLEGGPSSGFSHHEIPRVE
jgi:hypothetical protein